MAAIEFSVEVTPKAKVAEVPRQVEEVSITFLPGADYREIVSQAKQLRQQGFEPIPHIPARSLRSRLELADFIAQLKGEADIRQVLIVGGAPTEAAGPYDSTLSVLDTGLLDGFRIGVAGHPEGMPHLTVEECDRILKLKNDYARDTSSDLFIVTQWSLDAQAIHDWLDRIESFNTLPVYLGIAGPTTPTSLLKFASICGVKASLLGLRYQSARLTRLMTVQTPDHIIDALQHRIDHFHLYSFGGLNRTREWLEKRQAGVLVS